MYLLCTHLPSYEAFRGLIVVVVTISSNELIETGNGGVYGISLLSGEKLVFENRTGQLFVSSVQ